MFYNQGLLAVAGEGQLVMPSDLYLYFIELLEPRVLCGAFVSVFQCISLKLDYNRIDLWMKK
jgi:hypothetical protein